MVATDVKAVIASKELERKSAEEVVKWASDQFGAKLGLASSFGPEDVVLIYMLVQIKSPAKIFTLDTGRLNQETYDVMDKIKQQYGVTIDTYFPESSKVEQMVRAKGFNLFYESIENRKECCGNRKVQPLKRALGTFTAWMTGLRRDQVVTRAAVDKLAWDEGFNLFKFNPLAEWTQEQTWAYIKQHKIPYNALHDQGYPSIGCEPCTRAIKEGEDFRAGRWWWEQPEQKECGLHVKQH